MAVPYNSTVNFETIRGDSFTKSVEVTHQDQPAFDYTGTTILMQVKSDSEDSTALLEATPTPTIPGPGEMAFTIEFTAAEIGGLPVTPPQSEFVYDIEFTLPDSTVRTYLSGKFVVYADVSRS